MSRASEVLKIIRSTYAAEGQLPLHAPVFGGNESAYVQATIKSTFVSSVGAYVDQFENSLAEITGARHVIATSNGTTALHMSLILAGVQPGDLVLTQSLSFIATANSIAHAHATPAFVDVESTSFGMSPDALQEFLEQQCELTATGTLHRASGRRIAACVPMHTFGFPCQILAIAEICEQWQLVLIEDAAEALGSRIEGRHCGTYGTFGTLSFNGNKIVTTGGGGAIMTNDSVLAKRAKHLTTTAKIAHRWRFEHDEIGYNFRLPNLNAALGCAQLEQLAVFLDYKRDLAKRYHQAFGTADIKFAMEPDGTQANYWLCTILLDSREEREQCLTLTNDAGVMTRPVWEPLHTLQMFSSAPRGPLPVTKNLADRIVNIPSGYRSESRK